MIRYLLDTDTVSYLMKRRYPYLQARLLELSPEAWAISSITCAEILFGLESLSSMHPARERALAFLNAVQILDWPVDASPAYAAIRNSLRHQPIGDRDIMIAAHAIALDAILVTNNTHHFSRVGQPLRFENWVQ